MRDAAVLTRNLRDYAMRVLGIHKCTIKKTRGFLVFFIFYEFCECLIVYV
jgi:hypothetical protein